MDQIDPTLLALAIPVAFFVEAAVNIAKGVLEEDARTRWALPLVGIVLGWVFVGAWQAYQGVPLTPQSGAGALLAGFLAYLLAANQTALHKTVRRKGPGR